MEDFIGCTPDTFNIKYRFLSNIIFWKSKGGCTGNVVHGWCEKLKWIFN